MNTKKIENLVKEIERIENLMKALNVPETVLEKEVKVFGNGGHVVLPKQHLNKKVKVIVI
jgi:putative transposon-encoded protein